MKTWNPSIAISKLLSCVVLVFVASTQPCVAQSLIANSALPELTQEYLKSKTPAQWAELAKVQGDAGRGVNVFYQNNLACVRCHLPSGSQVRPLGPNLGHTLDIASADKLSDEQLVESILEPSKTIRKGYESITQD